MEHSYWETDSEIYTVLEIKLWLMLVKKNPQNKQLILITSKVLVVSTFFLVSGAALCPIWTNQTLVRGMVKTQVNPSVSYITMNH